MPNQPPSADATAGEREALTDWRLFLDAAEKYANQARELRELFNDPKMGELSSEYAKRFYALAKAARGAMAMPSAASGACAECARLREEIASAPAAEVPDIRLARALRDILWQCEKPESGFKTNRLRNIRAIARKALVQVREALGDPAAASQEGRHE